MDEAQGLDLLGVICGSEGQLGVVTEATLRILPKPEGARPVLMGFDSNEVAGECVSRHHQGRASCPSPSNSWTAPASEATEAFAKAGYPDVRGPADRRGRGFSPAEIDEQLGLHHRRSPAATTRWNLRESRIRG
jgi:glycolate oxidase